MYFGIDKTANLCIIPLSAVLILLELPRLNLYKIQTMSIFTQKMIVKAKEIFEKYPTPERYIKLEKMLERKGLWVNEYIVHLLVEVQKLQRKERENALAERLTNEVTNAKILKVTKCRYEGEKSLDILVDTGLARPVLYRVCYHISAPYDNYFICLMGTHSHATIDPTYGAYDELKSLYEHLLSLL